MRNQGATWAGLLVVGLGATWVASAAIGCLATGTCGAPCEIGGGGGITGGEGTTTGATAGTAGTAGSGGTVSMPTCIGTDASNCPSGNSCQERVCEQEKCGFQSVAQGESCDRGSGECDAVGNCSHYDGEPCFDNLSCVSMHCIDSVCCNETCGETCRSCNLPDLVGTCSNIPKDTLAGCPDSGVCNGGGACVYPPGVSCELPEDCLTGRCKDGVCCNEACTGTCRSCNIQGSEGTCVDIPEGADPDSECAISVGGVANEKAFCNGLGACKLPDGETCGSDAQCLHSQCIDKLSGIGVCCNEACSGVCRACRMSATGQPDGICANVPDGTIQCGTGKLCTQGACP